MGGGKKKKKTYASSFVSVTQSVEMTGAVTVKVVAANPSGGTIVVTFDRVRWMVSVGWAATMVRVDDPVTVRCQSTVTVLRSVHTTLVGTGARL